MSEDRVLHGWWNGYEVVAAISEEEARSIVAAMNIYEPQDVDGDGWKMIPDDRPVRDEDLRPTGLTMIEVANEMPEPRHLWSSEP